MQGNITKSSVEKLHPGEFLFDTKLAGFAARCLPSGRISFGLKYTDPKSGNQRWFALGMHGAVTAEQARRKALLERGRIAGGTDPQGEREAKLRNRRGGSTVNDLLDAHLKLYVGARGLRSAREISRCFNVYVRPVLGNTPVSELRRGHVVCLLDKVAAENGPVMADRVLAHLRKALNWHAARDETFVVPIVRGMAHSRPGNRARDRILDDNELRAFWSASQDASLGAFGTLVRVLLLTAQRREEVAGIRWSEISGDIWTIPAARAKNGRPNEVPVSPTAMTLLRSIDQQGDFIFGRDGTAPYSGFSKSKRKLDDLMRPALAEASPGSKWAPWTLHDLRRTARSLMARAGVAADISERVLNHAIAGVRGVYDRHGYLNEKRAALNDLAKLISGIVHSPVEEPKVIPFGRNA